MFNFDCFRDRRRGSDKLFVGGLSESFVDATLHSYFSKYGEIDDAVVMFDQDGKSRRFGFVRFGMLSLQFTLSLHSFFNSRTTFLISNTANPDISNIVLTDGAHIINGVKVTIEKAIPKDQISSNNGSRGKDRDRDRGGYDRHRDRDRGRGRSRSRSRDRGRGRGRSPRDRSRDRRQSMEPRYPMDNPNPNDPYNNYRHPPPYSPYHRGPPPPPIYSPPPPHAHTAAGYPAHAAAAAAHPHIQPTVIAHPTYPPRPTPTVHLTTTPSRPTTTAPSRYQYPYTPTITTSKAGVTATKTEASIVKSSASIKDEKSRILQQTQTRATPTATVIQSPVTSVPKATLTNSIHPAYAAAYYNNAAAIARYPAGITAKPTITPTTTNAAYINGAYGRRGVAATRKFKPY